jgi:hypothetical protein
MSWRPENGTFSQQHAFLVGRLPHRCHRKYRFCVAAQKALERFGQSKIILLNDETGIPDIRNGGIKSPRERANEMWGAVAPVL